MRPNGFLPASGPGSAGDLAFATTAVYEYEIGATPATSDLINLTGTGRTVSFGSTLDLFLTNPGGADVGGQTYVLIDYTGADPAALPAINFTGPLSGDVSIDSAGSQIVLTNVVPEPGSIALAAIAGAGLLLRRRKASRR